VRYAFEMDTGAIIYVPSFIKINSGIQKLIGVFTDTQTAWLSHKLFFSKMKVG
jgi:hypothetical protein